MRPTQRLGEDARRESALSTHQRTPRISSLRHQCQTVAHGRVDRRQDHVSGRSTRETREFHGRARAPGTEQVASANSSQMPHKKGSRPLARAWSSSLKALAPSRFAASSLSTIRDEPAEILLTRIHNSRLDRIAASLCQKPEVACSRSIRMRGCRTPAGGIPLIGGSRLNPSLDLSPFCPLDERTIAVTGIHLRRLYQGE